MDNISGVYPGLSQPAALLPAAFSYGAAALERLQASSAPDVRGLDTLPGRELPLAGALRNLCELLLGLMDGQHQVSPPAPAPNPEPPPLRTSPRPDSSAHVPSGMSAGAPAGYKVMSGKIPSGVVAKAKSLLSQPMGTEVPFEVDGKAYLARLEHHYHPPGYQGGPNGWHKGCTVYVAA